ncbi:uncharacterized protein [Centruroides vittatus]|uniref:uncharacterized protein n=1 Tax=Centruroides vittatus TaxID=120091 RepID=UPI00350F2B51
MDGSNPTFTPIEHSKNDIADTKEAKGRHVENPKHHLWTQAKRILRYLRGTTDYGILYNGNKKLALYSDADFAGNLEDRLSTSGYLLVYSGGAVSWHFRRRRTVVLATAEAIREMLFMRKFGLELKILRNL